MMVRNGHSVERVARRAGKRVMEGVMNSLNSFRNGFLVMAVAGALALLPVPAEASSIIGALDFDGTEEVLEDLSGEQAYRLREVKGSGDGDGVCESGETCEAILLGTMDSFDMVVTTKLEVGDIFAGVYEAEQVNSTQVGAGQAFEVTGAFLLVINAITDTDATISVATADSETPALVIPVEDFTFISASDAFGSAAARTLWEAIIGVDADNSGEGGIDGNALPDDAMLLLYESTTTNADFNDTTDTAFSTATDGDLLFVLGTGDSAYGNSVEANTTWLSTGTPEDPAQLVGASEERVIGSFSFGLNVLLIGSIVDFAIGLVSNIGDSGLGSVNFVVDGSNVLTPNNNLAFPVEDEGDILFRAIRIPEPATLGLMGIGLLLLGGMAGLRRRRAS